MLVLVLVLLLCSVLVLLILFQLQGHRHLAIKLLRQVSYFTIGYVCDATIIENTVCNFCWQVQESQPHRETAQHFILFTNASHKVS